jgi:hypothetical protein
MELTQTETQERTIESSREDTPVPVAPSATPAAGIAPQTCSSCGASPAGGGGSTAAPPVWIYAVGRIEARFPSISVEKEFAQAIGRTETKAMTDRQTLQAVLSKPENRYLVRQLCWVMSIEGLETYILVPRDPADYNLLVEALRPTPQPWDLDVVIGVKGPIAQPTMCNGLVVPIVGFDQVYSFDRETLIKAIPRPDKTSAKEFAPAAEELFDRILQMADNAGATSGDRALNYLAVRYPAIYANAAEAFGRNFSLTGVHVHPSPLRGTRNVVDVVFTYTNRSSDVNEKFSVRVDVTDEFPFLMTKLSPYYDR